MVALHCLKYNERPQLGQVLEVKDDKATIKWYDGMWSTKWKVYTYVSKKKQVAWVECLPLSSIILGGINLTSAGFFI